MTIKFPAVATAAITASIILSGCGSAVPTIVSTPLENIDKQPLKTTSLNEVQLKGWGGADIVSDTIPGMSVEKAYTEIIKDKQGQSVIVAVIDSGVDIEHEDLKNVIWTNTDEIPNNGIDDDKNGYIDDIHGWNFLGDIVEENMEYVRILRDGYSKFENASASDFSGEDLEAYNQYVEAKAEYDKEYGEAIQNKQQYEGIYQQLKAAHSAVSKEIGKEDYTKKELSEMTTTSEQLGQYKGFLTQMYTYAEGQTIPEFMEGIKEGVDYFAGRLNSHFNQKLNARATILEDNPDDWSTRYYGNNDVDGPDPKKADAKHGTHVAGIIAASRNNGVGMNGVAQNVEIMVIRAVPDGDEYDKDIANAIRYAVDNGAKVINTSFGKYFSTHPEWVNDAIEYAAKKDVLIVNAAGNEGLNLDEKRVYPNDQTPTEPKEISDTFLTVGSLTYTYGAEMVSSFSNYGKSNVDVFAPGSKIWSTTPLNEYEYLQGTSMAAPAAAGVAAMVRSYFPNLKASEVKQVLMESGLSTTQTVVVGGESSNTKPFTSLSTSGKMVNLYNALILASKK